MLVGIAEYQAGTIAAQGGTKGGTEAVPMRRVR
jgi:hypothetical protein